MVSSTITAQNRQVPPARNPMADYYPLLASVVAALDANTAVARRQLYNSVRIGFVTHMGKGGRPISDAEVTPERTALEEAIRKVEAEEVARLAGK
jgi:hypothetical protein